MSEYSSFKIEKVDVKGNRMEVDLVAYANETKSYELTFERATIEARGIKWDQFVKSVQEVVEELQIKGEVSVGSNRNAARL